MLPRVLLGFSLAGCLAVAGGAAAQSPDLMLRDTTDERIIEKQVKLALAPAERGYALLAAATSPAETDAAVQSLRTAYKYLRAAQQGSQMIADQSKVAESDAQAPDGTDLGGSQPPAELRGQSASPRRSGRLGEGVVPGRAVRGDPAAPRPHGRATIMPIRDLVLAGSILASVPFCFVYPWIGVLMWSWLAYGNPHRLTWDFAFEFPFAQAVAAATLAGFLFSRDRRPFVWAREYLVLGLLWAWFGISSMLAMYPEAAWEKFLEFSKILVMAVLVVPLFQDRQRLRTFVFVVGRVARILRGQGRALRRW